MIKPIVRVIPNLSGNVKLACNLSDFKKTSNEQYECYVRYARLLPISSNLAQRQYEVNLLNSAYEFDLKRFFNGYSNVFYSTAFSYDKERYSDADLSKELYNRDKDFEFGVKRISYVKNCGAQFAFFAPIWMDSANDVPDYFIMNIKINSSTYSTTKQIKVIINEAKKEYKHNYLSIYLNKYAKNLNTNVIFCTPFTNQATYFGIDLVKGGFVKKIDNIIGKNYKFQSTINRFDLNITEGFKRNKMCISQIMPLAFYFTLEDIFTEVESKHYAGARITVDGAYYKNNKKLKIYDFSTDYTELRQESWLYKNNKFRKMDTGKNIMDMPFPSLREASYVGYEHFNKIQKEAVRWKLKYSSDDYPYITNLSPAFSLAQQSHMKYREYPESFVKISVLDNSKNNVISPLYVNSLDDENSFYKKDPRILNRYANILQNNATTWFNVSDFTEYYEKHTVNNLADLYDKNSWYMKIDKEDVRKNINVKKTSDIAKLNDSLFNDIEIDKDSIVPDLYAKCSEDDLSYFSTYLGYTEEEKATKEPYAVQLYERHSIFDNPEYWSDVIDKKVYFKGILYDLSKIWRTYPDTPKIDKFGVFVKPVMNKISLTKLDELLSAKWTMLLGKQYLKQPNTVASPHIREKLTGIDTLSTLYINELSIGKKTCEVTHDSLFFANNSNTDGDFIDLNTLGFKLWEMNKYYSVDEVERKHPELYDTIERNRSRYVIESYKLLPVYRLSQIASSGMLWFEKNKMGKTKWIVTSLYFNSRENHNKVKYDKDTMSKVIAQSGKYMLEIPLMLKEDFISSYDLSYITQGSHDQIVSDSAYHYMFNPILVDQNEVYAVDAFTKTQELDINYGDNLPNEKEEAIKDIDFIYLDPYNMKAVMKSKSKNFKKEWLADDLYSRTFYAKFLNKMHLKVHLLETYADYDMYRDKMGRIEHIFVKRRILFNDYDNNQVYLKDLYIPLFEFYKNDYYDNYQELVLIINDRMRYDVEDNSDCSSSYDSEDTSNYSSSYEDRPKIVNDNGFNILQIPEAYGTYNDVLELLTIYQGCLRPMDYKFIYDDMTRRMLQDIQYDQSTDTWHFSKEYCNTHDLHKILQYTDEDPIQNEYTFELTFKKRFLKVNGDIWDAIDIDDKTQYKDLYLYRISKEDDYPESLRYQCTNDMSLFDSTIETCNTLQPLFNDVFLKERESATIYKEYNQSKITCARFGDERFYRYDCDNIPVMYDISTFDLTHKNIVDAYGQEYYSYSYLSHYLETCKMEETDPILPENIAYLPTYNILDNCNSKVSLAYGTEQVLQYYSKFTYSYITKSTTTHNSYYSEYENDRINFSYLNELNSYYTGEYSFETIYDDLDDAITTHVHTINIMSDVLNTYYDIHARYIPNEIEYNDLGLYDEFGISTYQTTYTYYTYYSYATPSIVELTSEDGLTSYLSTEYVDKYGFVANTGYCTYGLILIDANYDNTNSSMNLIDRFHNDKKFYTQMNGISIYADNFKETAAFTQFVPFIKFDLFKTLCNETPYVMKPGRYFLNAYNYPVDLAYGTDIFTNRKPLSSINLERYFDSITPLLTPVNTLDNSYMIKLENKELHSKVIKRKNETVLYKDNINIHNSNGTRVYDGKNDYEVVWQIENKHFNDNSNINLENTIKIFVGDKLSYDELVEAEEFDNVFNLFSKHMKECGTFDENEILFLYNKYSVKYDSYPVGIDYDRVCKVYSLTLIFKLL